MASIKRNFLYNAFYQVLVLILPLITAPYISRVMGAEKIGIYSYSYSVASYFGLFILLGLNNYGNRTVAGVKDDRNKLSRTFYSIYAMQLMMSALLIVLYTGYVIFMAKDKSMAWIQMIYLVSVIFDINWFFFGMEKFKMVVTRNTIVKIINLICIFTFVKTASDIYIYGLIMVTGMLVSQLMLWPFVPRYVSFVRVSFDEISEHIIPNLTLFVPVIAISLYKIMDKVMLGAMSSMTEVGFYENSDKLTSIPAMAITSLGTVMLPRMSNLIANGRQREAIMYIQKSLIVSALLSSSMAFGLSAVASNFVPFFYGKGFEECISIISILVLSSIFVSWANVIRTQYLIPNKKDRIYIVSVFLGAFVNVVVNLLLIPRFQAMGAAVGTFLAEAAVCTYQTCKIRREIRVTRYLFQSLPLLISGIIMYIVVVNIPFFYSNLVTLAIKVVIGGIVYVTLTGIYYLIDLKYIFKK